MPYERVEPAQWWQNAEAMPSKPAGDRDSVLVATPYGFAWRRPEPDAPDAPPGRLPAKPGTYRLVRTPEGWQYRRVGDGSGLIVGGESFAVSAPSEPPLSPPAEVRVGDLVRHGASILPHRVAAIVGTSVFVDSDTYRSCVAPSDIGPPGSGKPWTLLPPGMTETTVETDSGTVTTLTATHTVRDTPAIPPERARVAVLGDAGLAPDADTAGLIREGMRALDRIEAKAAAERARGPNALFDARVAAATRAFDSWRGSDHLDLMTATVRAALDVPDPRREAERRVIEAVRDATNPPPGGLGQAYVRLCGALRALAALDGEAGG